MQISEVMTKRKDRIIHSQVGITDYINALDDYELNILSWMEATSASNDYEGWVLYQLARAITCFRSCKILNSSGCSTDALAHSRTILDIYILVQWVNLDPAIRLKRATVDEVQKQRVYDAKRLIKSNTSEAMKGITEDNRRMIEDLASKDPRKMPGLPSTSKMAEEIEGSGLYGTMFGLSSAFLHNQGSELQFLASLRGTTTIMADPYPSKEHFKLAWLSAYFAIKTLWQSVSAIMRKQISYDDRNQYQIAQQLMQKRSNPF